MPSGQTKSYAVRFRPRGPWRFGPESGARDRVELIHHSDAVFSAVSSAMAQLGFGERWFQATAKSDGAPAVRFSSLYPFQGKNLLIVPPRGLWPPPESTKVRYKGARFVPLSVVDALLNGSPVDESRWAVDGESECLIPVDGAGGPFRVSMRSSAGVDRLRPGWVDAHATACLEFVRNSGLWLIVEFSDDDAAAEWERPVRSALHLLADSGLGGERSRGWGRSETPEWEPWTASWAAPEPGPDTSVAAPEKPERAYWLLSLYTPSTNDAIDWSRGSYRTVERGGRIESSAGWGEKKQTTVMIAEGSVLLAAAAPRGEVRDVAPAGFSHPVYRAGFALTVSIPWRAAA
jgi:CRISPR/Cas system CSM-associated protein Csm4 (group 5 of RAMP superfamily)